MEALPGIEDGFEEWLRVPMRGSDDPHHEIRRASEPDFNAIYDLVDEVFGFKRPRARNDWLYRQNPSGRARCFVGVEKATGSLVAARVWWPWPLARGDEPIVAALDGDWVVSRRLQRQGVGKLLVKIAEAHPGHNAMTSFGWASTQAREWLQKDGRGQTLMGPLDRSVLLLRAKSYWSRRGWPAAAASAAGVVADAALALRRNLLLGRGGRLAVEQLRQFDSSFDALTQRCMAWQGFWCPHNADFLNWRYLRHPTREHLCLAALLEGEPAGYCVLRLDREHAYLMEFAAPRTPATIARQLLLAAVAAARTAGSTSLIFFAPPRWRHWKLFGAAGFLRASSEVVLAARGPYVPEIRRLENWQVVPGDHDTY